ncbi:hypothetical protein ABPG74_008339 [Tetrahymena malaccensis]
MFKKDQDSSKVQFVRQASADVASNRGRKKKATPDISTLSQSFVQKTKKQPVVQSVTFKIPEKYQGSEDDQIQYLTEQLTLVNREIEMLFSKKQQIQDYLIDLDKKKRKRQYQDMRDESDEYDETNKYSFINQSRIRSSSQYGSDKKSNITSSLYQLAIQQNWNIDMTRFRDDPFHNDEDSYHSNYSQRSNKKTDDVSNILNELQTSKSMIKSKIMDKSAFNNSTNNNNTSVLSHTLNAQIANDTSNLYQSFMYRESSQQNLGSKEKLQEYNRLKDRCLWEHFNYKENIQDKLSKIDNLEENELKELAKNFGVKSKDSKLLKENLKNIYFFLARNKFPEDYLREFKTCIHEKIDVL